MSTSLMGQAVPFPTSNVRVLTRDTLKCCVVTRINGRRWACDLEPGHFGMHGSLLADAFEGES